MGPPTSILVLAICLSSPQQSCGVFDKNKPPVVEYIEYVSHAGICVIFVLDVINDINIFGVSGRRGGDI